MVQFDVKRVSKGTESFMVSFDFTKTPITQVADYIIIAASNHKASDIHFDPRDEGMMVRFRIDGDCQDYTYIPKAYEKNLTTRLKLLANMNITETRLPQDGAIKGEFGGQYLDMRVACLPTNQGEKIVIRILDYSRSLQGIDSLGFHPKNLEKIKRMIAVPNGIILVTGATGSGKSTTTYSMLSALNKPEVNVITVEDPVEMNIEGINQVQVNAEIGMTFAAALRSILREDPNVILIGEIRDSETAQIAVRASITGHLVMSTLHTNNALATVERLLDMDVERYLLSTALTGVISQRLAKALCNDCKYQREPTPYERKVYKKFLHQDIAMVWDANPKGCDNCRKGYKGRIAVHEVLELDDHIRNALNDETMKKEDFAKMIYTGKTISMLQDALIKALNGETSFEEVYRTIEIENEDEDNYAEEIDAVTEQKEEEEKIVNLPTGDDLLEDEGAKKNDEPLTKAIQIPGITSRPDVEEEEEKEAEEPKDAPKDEKKEPTKEEPASPPKVEEKKVEVQAPTKPVVPPAPQEPTKPLTTAPSPTASPTVTPSTAPTQPAGPVQPTTPVPTHPNPPAEQPKETIAAAPIPTPPVAPTQPAKADPIPSATLGPDGKLIVPAGASEHEQKQNDDDDSMLPEATEVLHETPPETKHEESTPLVPNLTFDEPAEQKPLGYTIAMPKEEPAPVAPNATPTVPQVDIKPVDPFASQAPLAPLVPLIPTIETNKVESTQLDDETTTNTNDEVKPRVEEIVTTTAPTVQQLAIPTGMPQPDEEDDKNKFIPLTPSFDTKANPTDIANQLLQIATPDKATEQKPEEKELVLPRIQAVSVLPALSEEAQELSTASEVLNDPGIRIAESPTPELKDSEEVIPLIPVINN